MSTLHPLWLMIIAGMALFLSGCAELRPMAVSTSTLNPEVETPIGIVQGVAENTYLIGFTVSEEGMRKAVDAAKKQVDADNLVNIYVDQRTTNWPFKLLPLYTRVETIVTGTATRYKDRSLNKIPDQTQPQKDS